MDAMREKEIISKAGSAIILLLMKWFKSARACSSGPSGLLYLGSRFAPSSIPQTSSSSSISANCCST